MEEEDPFYRKTVTYCNYGNEGGQVPKELKGLLQVIGITDAPEYIIKRTPRPGRDAHIAKVHIYDHNHIISTHKAPAPRLSAREAVAGVAWEAITVLPHVSHGVIICSPARADQ